MNAYYEALYEQLEAKKGLLESRIEKLLREEIANLGFENFEEDKYSAYRDACLAFVDERIEAYNPIGIQYTFDRIRAREAVELELQLNWFDSQAEFKALMDTVRSKTELEMTDERIQQSAEELIKQLGAFPDNSIISAYKAGPSLGKLPDYVAARAIEEIIR